MNHNDYSQKLKQLEDCNSTNLVALGTWVRNDALPWLWNELGGAILTPKQQHPNAPTAPRPPKLTPMTDADAVRQGLMVSVADRVSKLSEPSYYRAQLTMLDKEATRYCKNIDAFSQAPSVFAEDAVVHTLHRALREMMQYALILLEDAAHNITEVAGYFAAWRRKRETSFEVYKGTEQIIYGTYSGMTHADRAPYTPVAVLRTAIELRLRGAFCVSRETLNKSSFRFSRASTLESAFTACLLQVPNSIFEGIYPRIPSLRTHLGHESPACACWRATNWRSQTTRTTAPRSSPARGSGSCDVGTGS